MPRTKEPVVAPPDDDAEVREAFRRGEDPDAVTAPKVSDYDVEVAMAARAIKDKITAIGADVLRRIKFAKDVALRLGHDPGDHAAVAAVDMALTEHNIEPPGTAEYPKMLVDDQGKAVLDENDNHVIFNNAEEESAYQPAAKPAEPKAAESVAF